MNYNVFLNQRHLGFGLLIAAIAIMYFIDRLEWLDDIEVNGEGRLSRLKSGCMIVSKGVYNLIKGCKAASAEEHENRNYAGCSISGYFLCNEIQKHQEAPK